MGWKDLRARVRGLLGGQNGSASHRPDGGTSCYRPIQRRNRQEENLARAKASEYAANQPQIPYAHTGFTGMNPPSTGNAPVQSTFAADPYGYGAAQAARQEYRAQEPAEYGMNAQEPAAGTNNISYMPGAHLSNKNPMPWLQFRPDHLCYAHGCIEAGRRYQRVEFFLQDCTENELYACLSPTPGNTDPDQVVSILQNPLCIPEIQLADCLLNRPGQQAAQ